MNQQLENIRNSMAQDDTFITAQLEQLLAKSETVIVKADKLLSDKIEL